MTDAETRQFLPPVDAPASVRRRRLRTVRDAIARHAISLGGIGVIIAITLIFIYLLAVVFPMFLPADAEPAAEYHAPGTAGDKTLLLAMEEQARIGLRVTDGAEAIFFDVEDGREREVHKLPLPAATRVTAFADTGLERDLLALGLSDGAVLIVRHRYEETFPEDRLVIVPAIDFPLGEAPLRIDDARRGLVELAVGDDEHRITVAAVTEDGELLVARFFKSTGLLDDTLELEREAISLGPVTGPIARLLMGERQRWLYVVGESGSIDVYDLQDINDPVLNEQGVALVESPRRLTAVAMLLGNISLLVGDDRGGLSQWFNVRDQDNRYRLHRVREFVPLDAGISSITSEYRRKGFVVGTDDGELAIYHSTADRRLMRASAGEGPIEALAVSPRGDAAMLQTPAGIQHWRIDNEHPEVSFAALWHRVWYEGYSEPEHIWQSSAATTDFEPKFSIVPLAFGTLKAAAYAMLIAIPLAIMGAIYTAYFMAPRLRQLVKPTIEIMEALPTVILGFLAGLWLAPFIEGHLPGVFSLLLVMPFTILIFGVIWQALPEGLRLVVPEGWRAALLVPIVVLAGWLSMELSPALETALFAGDMRLWLTRELGLDFDQRNSIVVGIAMGFAVIPTIFSIAEDAIFSVPRHLVHGSLALGATPWQALSTVVMPTASPAIFSAVMMGLGRAVGETMIVLMATGNTAIMDFNIFEGMRTLSANIAVEMPESEVGSTHYRVLFLTALVLFMFTFVLNTGAEIVRQRLRRRYATL